jgi:cytoskeleton protein RodZ
MNGAASMTEPGAPGGAGALLRAARERQGLHIAALAAAIKVSPRKLNALENDRWDELPDATFARALAQTVCRQLKIDAKPVLDQLPAASTAALEHAEGGINAPFRDRPLRDEPGFAAAAIKPMVWGAALLMLAAVVVYFLPPGFFSRAPSAASAAVSAPVQSPVAAPVVVAQPVAPVASAPAAVAAAASAVVPPTSGETVFSAPATPLAASAPPMAGIVRLRTSEASWIEVRDARGASLLSRTVLPGEAVGLDGQLPIRLTIGNASATQLEFRGQPVDLSARTRDNVARVDLQ